MPRLFTGLEMPEVVVGQLALLRGGVVGRAGSSPRMTTSRFDSSATSTRAWLATSTTPSAASVGRSAHLLRGTELVWW